MILDAVHPFNLRFVERCEDKHSGCFRSYP